MKKLILIAVILFMMQMFIGCGDNPKPKDTSKEDVKITEQNKNIDLNNVKDGTYTVESDSHERLGNTKLTLTIKDGKITNAVVVGIDRRGNVKGEDYGAGDGDKESQNYKKAQTAIKAYDSYVKQLIDTQSLDKVDAISGATIAYNQFVDAVNKAVDESKK